MNESEKMDMISALRTFPIYETEYLNMKIMCRRHKKKRINKKLNKKYGIKWLEVPGKIMLVDGKIFCSRRTALMLRQLIERGGI